MLPETAYDRNLEAALLESRGYTACAAMVRAYAGRLDAELDQIGNDRDAYDRLVEALDRLEPADDDNDDWNDVVGLGAPTCREECFGDESGCDWEEYEMYLDRLDALREYPPATSPRWQAFLDRAPLND